MRRLLPLLLLAGCVPASRPAVAPPRPAAAPRPAAPAPTYGADWRDWPVAPGAWAYRRDERGSVALFGVEGADAAAVLRCDRGRGRLFLSRAGDVPGDLTVRTSSVVRRLPAAPTGGRPPYTAAALAPSDPLLDAMAFSRGRFALEQPGAPPLVLPAYAEVGRVTEDCRG